MALPEGKDFFTSLFNSFVKKPVYFAGVALFGAVLMRLPTLCTYFDALK